MIDNIVLCRIDSRLIHGQVMTKWVNQSQANKIIVVSDELVNDEFMKSIYMLSAPEGITVECYSEQQIIDSIKANEKVDDAILLLLPSLEAMHRVYINGLHVKAIQVGGLGGAPNRKAVFQNITLDDADVKILEDLSSQGVDIYFQTIPEDTAQDVKTILEKYKG